jgi:hypothetical protein
MFGSPFFLKFVSQSGAIEKFGRLMLLEIWSAAQLERIGYSLKSVTALGARKPVKINQEWMRNSKEVKFSRKTSGTNYSNK